MNTQGLDGDVTLVLIAHQEAIRAAQASQQIKQFIHAHHAAAKWACANGLQDNSQWLEGDNSQDPYGSLLPGAGKFLQGISWLCDQGWIPGEQASTLLLTQMVLEAHQPAHQPMVENADGDGAFARILDAMAHHQAPAQARICHGILSTVSLYDDTWHMPRSRTLLEWMTDHAILLMEDLPDSLSKSLDRQVEQRKATARARWLDKETPTARGCFRGSRM